MLAKSRMHECIWLRGWSDEDLNQLLTHAKKHSFRKSQVIYEEEKDDNLVLIVSGTAWTCLKTQHGVVKFGLAYPTILIGLSKFVAIKFQDEPRYQLIASEDSEVLFIPKNEFIARLDAKPHLWRAVAEAAILYQRHSLKLSLVLHSGPIKDRLISAIYQFGISTSMHYRRSLSMDFNVPQEDLAILIQSSRQHVNRGLNDLASCGLIKIAYKRIEIIDPDTLEKIALSRINSY